MSTVEQRCWFMTLAISHLSWDPFIGVSTSIHTLLLVPSITHIMMGWGKVSLRFHLSPQWQEWSVAFFFFLAHLMTHMINSPQVHFKGDSPSRGLLPWTLHQLFYNSKSLLDEGQNEGLWIYKEKCHSQSLLSAFKNASLLYSGLQQIFTTQISTCMHFTTALMFCKTFAPIRLSSILSLS